MRSAKRSTTRTPVFQAEEVDQDRLQQQGPSQMAQETREDFDFEAGDQLNEEDRAIPQDELLKDSNTERACCH
jgi:hypothetical protein